MAKKSIFTRGFGIGLGIVKDIITRGFSSGLPPVTKPIDYKSLNVYFESRDLVYFEERGDVFFESKSGVCK